MEKARKLGMWWVVGVSMVVVTVAVGAPQAEGAMSCSTVANALMPCLNFVMNGGAAPPAACCDGVKTLYREASATADRRVVCSCLKSVAGSATPAVITNAALLPTKCGVSIPYKISPSTDCASIH